MFSRVSYLLGIFVYLVIKQVQSILTLVEDESMNCEGLINQARESFYSTSELSKVHSSGVFYMTQVDKELLNMVSAKCIQFKSKAFSSELYIIDISMVTKGMTSGIQVMMKVNPSEEASSET